MIDRIANLVTTSGLTLVWLVAVGIAIWQILRGRALAGVAIGLAAVFGIGILVAQSLLGPVWAALAEVVGWPVSNLASYLTFGTLDALVITLLVVAAVVQRPPKETG